MNSLDTTNIMVEVITIRWKCILLANMGIRGVAGSVKLWPSPQLEVLRSTRYLMRVYCLVVLVSPVSRLALGDLKRLFLLPHRSEYLIKLL